MGAGGITFSALGGLLTYTHLRFCSIRGSSAPRSRFHSLGVWSMCMCLCVPDAPRGASGDHSVRRGNVF